MTEELPEAVRPAAARPEAVRPENLFDDVAFSADLKAKVSDAWREFARQLAGAVPQLPDGTVLDLTLDPTASGTGDAVYSVQLACDGGEILGTAVGNADLPSAYRLDRSAIAGLVALGWSPPGVVPGSGDAFGLRLPAAETGRLGVVVARTMRDVYGAPHPAFVTYTAYSGDAHDPVTVPPLGAARPATVPEEPVMQIDGETGEAAERALANLAEETSDLPLAERVALVVSRLLKMSPEALPSDPDGDISIRAGSAMVFVRVRDNPPLIDVFSPVLTEVQPTHKLFVRLSELTHRMPIGRLYCIDDTVWASVPVFGRNFQASHLMLAVQVMTGLADELDDRLLGEFGGKRFFGEGDKAALKGDADRDEEPERTGMYL